MALPEITVEDLNAQTAAAKDDRQRLQKSLRAGQLNIVKAVQGLHNPLNEINASINLFSDKLFSMFDKDRAQAGFKLEQQREEQTKIAEAGNATPAPAPTPATAPPPPKPDPKAEEWAQKNTWFGQDQTMTYAAFGLHKQLIEEEGFDATSDEYYTELDNRIRSEFPHKFQETQKKSSSPRVASAGTTASKSSSPKGRRTVKLTASQIAIAKRLNVPLEEYAKYVKE